MRLIKPDENVDKSQKNAIEQFIPNKNYFQKDKNFTIMLVADEN